MQIDITDLVVGLVDKVLIPAADDEVSKTRNKIDDWAWNAIKARLRSEAAKVQVTINVVGTQGSTSVSSQ